MDGDEKEERGELCGQIRLHLLKSGSGEHVWQGSFVQGQFHT